MKEINLTQGAIFQKLIRFSLPMIAGNLLQQIYNLVDTLIVGRCLGADVRMQKSALFRQIGTFFLMPFAFPLLMTVPMGLIFGKVYEIWDFAGLSGQKAMGTAVMLTLTVTGIYALYFIITYRIACDRVVCYGSEKREILS